MKSRSSDDARKRWRVAATQRRSEELGDVATLQRRRRKSLRVATIRKSRGNCDGGRGSEDIDEGERSSGDAKRSGQGREKETMASLRPPREGKRFFAFCFRAFTPVGWECQVVALGRPVDSDK